MPRLSKKNLIFYKERLLLNNNFCFLKDFNNELFFKNAVIDPVYKNVNNDFHYVVEIMVGKEKHFFIIKKLPWDSKYFAISCLSIEFILFNHADYKILRKAINLFIELNNASNSYVKINVSSEDLLLVQAISSTSFNLVETRLHYFLKIKQQYESTDIRDIKIADHKDIPQLRFIAKKMRNRFDRVHADPAFSEEVADNYLAQFVEECVKGFADIVLKISDKNDIPFGFLAANLPVEIYEQRISKLVLAAIDSDVSKGRLIDLLSEMVFRLRSRKADYLTTITQSANIPAIRVWEKMAFSLYKVTNLYTMKND